MITLLSILCLGFFLGMKHATDADHVVAVTTIVSQQRSIRGAAWIGAFWGIGHSLTLLLVGGAIVLLGLVIPESLGLSLEFSVALMLLLLGTLNVKASFRWIGSAAQHSHDHLADLHGPAGEDAPPAKLDRWFGNLRAYRVLRPMIIGVVHGLAGSAAVALLVLPVIQNAAWAIAYLLIFGAGTIAGMMLITAAIAVPLTYASAQSSLIHRYLGATAGVGSCCFGAYLVYQIGFVDQLFLR